MSRPTPDPFPGGERALVRAVSVPLLGGVRGGFMVPIRGVKVVQAFHEPQDALLADEQVTHLGVHGPNAFEKRKGALHEPTHRRPLPRGEPALLRVRSVPLLGGLGVGSCSQCGLKKRGGFP